MPKQPEYFDTVEKLAGNLKQKLGSATDKKKVVAIYAFNATGKTRLSNLLSDYDSEDSGIKTLCYNAFLEDTFVWDNENFVLRFNLNSWFIKIIKEQ
jgi:hypothetical protein